MNTCLPPYRDKTGEDTNLSLVSVSAQSLQEEQMFDGGELGDKGRHDLIPVDRGSAFVIY